MEGPGYFDPLRQKYSSPALKTWIVGHRGLFVICRELHRSLLIIEAANEAGDTIRVAQQMARLASITRACSVAFKFTGNMTKRDYKRKVVAPMVKAHPKFTGMWARDHSAMLQQLHETFRTLIGFEPERANIKLITSFMVKQHERICERLAHGRPSLNAQNRSGSDSQEEGYLQLRNKFGPRHLRYIDRRRERPSASHGESPQGQAR
jgi:hypothetical protein